MLVRFRGIRDISGRGVRRGHPPPLEVSSHRRRFRGGDSPFRAAVFLGLLFLLPVAAHAQGRSGSAGAALGGATLGLVSGTLLGATGSIIPCSETLAGHRCVRIFAVAGGAVGLTSGAVLGLADEEATLDALRGGAYGALAGAAVGFALKEVVHQYGWADVAMASGLGLTFGAAPKGALIGLGAGAVSGAVLLLFVPDFRISDAAALALAGIAAGGLTQWVWRAVDAQADDPSATGFSLSISFAH